MDHKYIIVLDNKIYRIYSRRNFFYDSFMDYPDYMEVLCRILNIRYVKKYESLYLLIINAETNDVMFNFANLRLQPSECFNKCDDDDKNYYVGLADITNKYRLHDKLTAVDCNTCEFINETIRDKSDESIFYLNECLHEFADKYISVYNELCNISVPVSKFRHIKSAIKFI